MRIEDFFIGRLEGWGAVVTAGGRVSRRLSIAMEGVWLERERALRLSETYAYGEEEPLQREWTIHVDHEGRVVGRESAGPGRLKGRESEGAVRLRYDGPRGPRRRLSPPLTLDFILAGDGVVMAGRVGWGPLVLARLHGALSRVDRAAS